MPSTTSDDVTSHDCASRRSCIARLGTRSPLNVTHSGSCRPSRRPLDHSCASWTMKHRAPRPPISSW